MADSSRKDARAPTLIVTGGPLAGTVLPLDLAPSEKLLGSGPGCHLRLAPEHVAEVHARVVWDAGGLRVSDAGSAAGTFVNSVKVGADHPLRPGDRISLGAPGAEGSVELLVGAPAEVSEAAPAPSAPPPAPGPPAPAGPPTAAAAAPQPTAPAAHRKPARGDYTSELPSIAGDRVHEPVALPPPAAEPAGRRRAVWAGVPRPVVLAIAAAALTGGGFLALRRATTPPPVVLSVVPPKAEPGLAVTLNGTGFDSTLEGNTVRFGDQSAQVTSASPTQLNVTVPEGLEDRVPADVPVGVESRGGRSNTLFFRVYRRPRILALEPEVALPGREVVLRGRNLSGDAVTVRMGEWTASVKDAGPTELRAVVPEMPLVEGRSVPVTVQVDGDMGPPVNLFLGHLPLVTALVPGRGRAGDRLTVRGYGFEPGSVVTVGGQRALLLKASERELSVVVPAMPLPSGLLQAPVVVKAGGAASAGPAVFGFMGPSGPTFIPRYFAALVPGDDASEHAFVANELGPVLLLTGKADAPSTGERAARAAAALNALFESAARPVSFELREAPAPAVAVSGRPQVLLTATPEDAAGYAKPWDASVKPRRVAPRMVAAYWAALLQDHAALFIQGQRPIRVVELSPRGKVLVDLYAEAARRGRPGAGVPAGLVSPVPPKLARDLRDLALLLPAEGESAAGAAVAGRWEGTMEDSGGTRPIQVQFRLEGSRLKGSLTTRAGGLAMDVPLDEIAYQRGVLSFLLKSGGSPRRFQGNVYGAQIAGTIETVGGRQAPGRFSLKYVE